MKSNKISSSSYRSTSQVKENSCFTSFNSFGLIWSNFFCANGSQNEAFESQYTIGEQIGKGAFAVVHKAVHIPSNEERAVKIITRANASEDDLQLVKEEASILLELSHPHIVKCFQFYEEPESFYIVLEMVNGGELFDRIAKRTFYSEEIARDLVEILLSTIKHCHDHDIVHRDLKPENLLLVSHSEDAEIKLADFGLAAKAAGSTLTGFCGSPGYIAPEILCGFPHGKPVDMWAIGIITYVLLGGYLPFDDPDKGRTNKLIKRGIFEFHEVYWAEVSEDAKSLIKGLLTVDAKKRLSANEAMKHPWIKKPGEVLAERNLENQLTQLKRFNAKRKFKGIIKALIFFAKIQRFASTRKLSNVTEQSVIPIG